MEIFNKKGKNDTRNKVLNGSPESIPAVVKGIINNFKSSGYEIMHQVDDNNSHDILVQKSGALGLKTVLKVTVGPLKNNRINFKTTEYGLLNSKLDDEALRIAELIAGAYSGTTTTKANTLLSGITSILQQPVSKQVSAPKTSQPAPALKPSKPRLGGSSGKGSW